MRGLISGLRTLTRIPCPGRESTDLADALPYFPLIGALLGMGITLAVWFMSLYFGWPLGGATVAVALMTWLTRGLHLDGLADVTDALGGGHTRERRLAIMKDPHTGAFGVIAVVLVLILKIVAIEQLALLRAWPWLALPVIAARTLQVKLIVMLPYARAEGGTAAPFVQNARQIHGIIAIIAGMILSFLIGGWAGIFTLSAAVGFSVIAYFWFLRLFGGITGDGIGFMSEITEVVLFVILAAGASFVPQFNWGWTIIASIFS